MSPKWGLSCLEHFGNLLVYSFDKMGVNDPKSGAYQGAMIMAIVFGLYQAFALAQYSFYDESFAMVEWVVGIVHGILGGAAILTIQRQPNSERHKLKRAGRLACSFFGVKTPNRG